MILNALATNIDAVLDRLTLSHLRRYAELQTNLRTRNVATDEAYQRTFNGFYRMQRRTSQWYSCFFAMLEREKGSRDITFARVLKRIHADTNRVEPSFSSKLVATIRPEKPVYDKHVRENLSLEVPAQYRPARERIEGLCRMYDDLERKVAALIADPVFTTSLRPAFDKKWPAFSHFTDTKKLDLLLWQFRGQDARTDNKKDAVPSRPSCSSGSWLSFG